MHNAITQTSRPQHPVGIKKGLTISAGKVSIHFSIPLPKDRPGPGAFEDFPASYIVWLVSIVNFITIVRNGLLQEPYSKTKKIIIHNKKKTNTTLNKSPHCTPWINGELMTQLQSSLHFSVKWWQLHASSVLPPPSSPPPGPRVNIHVSHWRGSWANPSDGLRGKKSHVRGGNRTAIPRLSNM